MVRHLLSQADARCVTNHNYYEIYVKAAPTIIFIINVQINPNLARDDLLDNLSEGLLVTDKFDKNVGTALVDAGESNPEGL